MATGGGPPSSSDDWLMHLTCSLCLDIFTDPKMVPGCLHTYCLKCLEELASQHTRTFPCPECRAQVEIPAGGVASFQPNRFLRSQDLARARNGTGSIQAQAVQKECTIHPKQDLDQYCVDCELVLCPICLVKEHRNHVSKELQEVAAEFKAQLTNDLKHLQKTVSYMIGELEVEEKGRKALQDEKAALEKTVLNRHATLIAIADKYRDDMMTSLNVMCSDIEKEQSKEQQMKQNNLDTLLQLQQQALQAVSSGEFSDLLNVSKEMKDGRGSSQKINTLKTPKRDFVTGPALVLKVSEDALKKQMEELMQDKVEKETSKVREDTDRKQVEKSEKERLGTVITQSRTPEVTVNKQFVCGPEEDIEVFSLCPQDDGTVSLSFAKKGLLEDIPFESYYYDGKLIYSSHTFTGRVTSKSMANERMSLMSYMIKNQIYTYSKSHTPTKTCLRLYCIFSSGHSVVEEETIVSENPFKAEVKSLFNISTSGPQRAFDVDSNEQLFVVLEDAQAPEKRRVHLYLRDQKKSVATYTPPSPDSHPSDVCFMTLGGQELLIVADEDTSSLHVVRVTAGGLTFLRYLAPDCPLLVQPTALNTDHEGRLWVACKGGSILTVTPTK